MPVITLPTVGEAAWGTKMNTAVNAVNTQVDTNTTNIASNTTAIGNKLDTSAAAELIRDTMGAALVAGANVTITVNDAGDTITIASSGGGGGVSPTMLPRNSGDYLQGVTNNDTAAGSTAFAGPVIALSPIVVGGALTIDALACLVTTAEAVDIRLYLYSSDSTGHPSTLVATSTATVSTASTYVATLGTPVALTPGVYWVGIRSNGGSTIRFRCLSSQNTLSAMVSVASDVFQTTRVALPSVDTGTFASPTTPVTAITYTNLGTASYPVVGLRKA